MTATIDFIQLFNGVVKLAKPVTAEQSYAKSLDDKINDLDIDSLDTIMLSMYLGEVYGIDEDTMREMHVETIAQLQEFLESKKTHTPSNIEEELARVK